MKGSKFRSQVGQWAASALLLLLAAVVSAGAYPAQQFSSLVDLQVLELRVEDEEGRFVSGLDAGDIVVTVDGEQVPVTLFYEVNVPLPGDEEGSIGSLSVGPATRSTRATLADRLRPKDQRRFLFFLDFLYPTRSSVRYSFAGVLYFLENLVEPGDLVGLAIYGNTGLGFVVPFTDRHERVKAMVRTMSPGQFREMDTMARTDLQDMRAFDAAVSGSALAGDASAKLLTDSIEESEDARSRGQLVSYIESIGYVGEMLSVLPGATQVIFMSRGFMDLALEDRIIGDAFEATLESLEHSGATFHAIDPGAMRGISVHDPSFMQSRVDLGDLRAAFGSEFALRGPLYSVAERTGGTTTWFSHNLTEGLDRIDRVSRQYYIVGFKPVSAEASAQLVDIRLVDKGDRRVVGFPRRVGNPGPYVQWTEDQRRLSVAEAVSGGRDRADFTLDVGVTRTAGPDTVDGSELATAAAYFTVPLESLPTTRGAPSQFEILILSADDTGHLTDFLKDIVPLRNVRPPSGAVRYLASIHTPPGGGRVTFLVRDRSTGALASRTVVLESQTGAWLARPILLAPGREGLAIQGRPSARSGDGEAGGTPWPLTVRGAALSHTAASSRPPGGTVGLLAAGFGFGATQGDASEPLQVELLALDGVRLTLPLQEAAREIVPGGWRAVVGFQLPPELKPGMYQARVRTADSACVSEAVPIQVESEVVHDR
jgi:VWFA-related protein